MIKRTAVFHAVSIALSLAIAGPIMAQTDQQTQVQDDEQAVLEEVFVTGSRIRRNSYNVSTPIVTVGHDAITDSGLGSLSEILIDEIPQLYESASNTNSQSSVSQTGLSTINLRQLGANRTLTLIDGRRTVANSYSGSYISLSTIPSSLIERVEIITGGSSAAYGSDAVAGVVNIITETNRVGLTVNGRYGWTPEGGGEETTLNADYGLDFADGKGYFFIGAEYFDQGGITWNERDRAAIESSYDYNTSLLCNENNTIDGDQCMRDITRADWRERSDGMPGGVFEENKAVDGYWYDENNVLRDDWSEERDGINPYQWDMIRIPNKRYNIAGKINWDFTENTAAFFQAHYNETTSINYKSPEDEYEGAYVGYTDPETGELSRIRPGFIKTSNPYAPAEIADNAGSSISWDRRYFEVGQVTTDNNRKTIRTWTGIHGKLFDDQWDWEASVGYGKFKQEQHRLNEIDVQREAWALDAEYADDGVTIQCASAEARADGCVPMNIFGIGSITKEAADYIRVNPTITSKLSQLDAVAYMTGDLFQMPAGAVPAVFGVEYRKDTLDLKTSPGQANGGITFNVVPQFKGDIDVMEVFTEFSFPLTKSLTADISARAANYSPDGIDTVFSYTSGLMWTVADGYHLRANYSVAQRAPTITELMSPPRGDYDSYTDICDGATATSNEPGHDNCRLDPGVAAAIAANGTFEDENNSYSPNVGNEDLYEETGDTWTVGISMEPSFIPNFRLAVDYYNITITDVIGSYGNEQVLGECYDSTVAWGSSNPFCNDISRDDEGQIYEVLQRLYNLDETKTDGIDVTFDWVFELGDYGDLTWNGDYSHIFNHTTKFQTLDGFETVSYNNQLDYGIFANVASTSLTWRKNGWRVRWFTKYKGSIVDHDDRVEDYKERFAENDAACSAGSSDCITNPEVPKYLYYPSTWRHDISVSYAMDLKDNQRLRLYGGVKNVFNDQGPFVPRTGDNYESGIGNFDSKFEGGIGRFVYLGAQWSWD